jgi:hypothetical protein
MRQGEDIKVYKVLVGKPEGKRPLRRLRHRWEDGSQCIFGRLAVCGGGGGGGECFNLTKEKEQWQAVVNAVMNLWVLVPWS